MAYNEVAPLSKQMTIVTGLGVVGLMAFGLALSYYKNILFDHQLVVMEERNAALKDDVREGNRRLQYLESDQYKDKYAKESLGLIRPGEKALLIATEDARPTGSANGDLSEEEKQALLEENLRAIRIVDQWKLYLFHREQIDDLRKTL